MHKYCFYYLLCQAKKYGTVQVEHGNIFETTKSAHLMNAVNAKNGAAYTSTTDRTVGRAERLRVAGRRSLKRMSLSRHRRLFLV